MNANGVSSMSTHDIAIACTDEETITSVSNRYAQINSTSFIFHLPTEILESIFIDCARDYHSKDSGRPTPTVPSWVNVSYVCRHWRNVALNYPALWTYLFVMSPRWTEELLARSKQAPLKLHMEPYYQDEESRALRFAEPVIKHVERIQELHLHVFNAAQYFSKLCSPTPCLKSVKISMERNLEWSSVPFNLNGDTPALRTLELSHCPLPWYSLKLGGLTTLSLDCVPVEFQQNTGEFLATLSCMQDLKYLYLDISLRSAAGFLSSTAFRAFRKINLPRLSRLRITAPFSTVIALLSCANIPLKTKVRLQCHAEVSPSPDDYAPLPSLLARRFDVSDDQVPLNPKIHSLAVEFTTRWGNGRLRFSRLERDCDYNTGYPPGDEWGCNIPLQVGVRFGHPRTSDRDRLMTNICCSVPLTNVQSLHVIDPPFSSAFWRKTFGHLRDLRYLKLSHGDMPDIASILSLTPLGHTENQGIYAPNQIFAPVLEELELDTIKFPSMPPPAHDMDWPTVTTDVQSLYDALSSRNESRGRLTMSQCAVDGHVVDLDVVGEWEDGHFCVVAERSQPWCYDESDESEDSNSQSLEDG